MKMLYSRQEAKLNMYQAVEDHCDANASILPENPAFKLAYEEFKPIIPKINVDAVKSGAVLTGITQNKTVSKQDLSKAGASVATLIYAYAAKHGDHALRQAVDFSASDLLRAKDGELAPRCQGIHDAGTANLAALADYGVTAAKLANLQTLINAYDAQLPKPRTASNSRSVTKANIKQYFKDADDILTEQMDKLIDAYADDHPDFVAGYKKARIIIDPKTGKKIIGGTGSNPPA